jgi:hypothetical protein
MRSLRAELLLGYFLWVITQISSRAVVPIHLPRIAAVLADHDTFRRLGAI